MKDSICFVGLGSSLSDAWAFELPGISSEILDREAILEGFISELSKYEWGFKLHGVPKLPKVEKVINNLMTLIEEQ